MVAQGVLPFKYEADTHTSGATALAGLPVYLDLAQVLGLGESVRRHLKVRPGTQGWTDEQIVMSLVLLNLAGGDCVDDVRVLEGDEGFCRVLRRTELFGLSRRERRATERRWRKERRRAVPSPSSVFRYLERFHEPAQEALRQARKAFIPAAGEHLQGLRLVNRDLVAAVQRRSPSSVATLDMDATLVECFKAAALYCYKHFKSYQPLNVWWAEQGLVLHSEFRDGNVPAGFEQLRVLKEAEAMLPEGVRTLRMRSDTAGYQEGLLRYCEMGTSERFGRIEFAVSADVTREFKRAVAEVPESEWHPIHRTDDKGALHATSQQWAEVCFVPSSLSRSTKGTYRFLAVREPLAAQPLPGMGEQLDLPFPTMAFGTVYSKLFGVVTNLDWDGEAVVLWLRERCGKSEEAHSIMKSDLAGGQLPSAHFGANAAWWAIMLLSLNLNEAMKRLVLGGLWATARLKAIRFHLIQLPGRVLSRARQLFVHLRGTHPSLEILLVARQKILALAAASPT
jgi:hypothetical protein